MSLHTNSHSNSCVSNATNTCINTHHMHYLVLVALATVALATVALATVALATGLWAVFLHSNYS